MSSELLGYLYALAYCNAVLQGLLRTTDLKGKGWREVERVSPHSQNDPVEQSWKSMEEKVVPVFFSFHQSKSQRFQQDLSNLGQLVKKWHNMCPLNRRFRKLLKTLPMLKPQNSIQYFLMIQHLK